MSGAPAGFSEAFWHHQEKPLRNLCLAHARCLVAGVEDWHEAYGAVWHDAIRHGALHLPEDSQGALRDWIAVQLSDDIAQAEIDRWDLWPNNPQTREAYSHG